MRSGRGIFGGVVLIALGFLWLLNNLHIVVIHDLVQFWPILLIIWGISMFLRPDRFYRADRKEYRHTKHEDERPESPRETSGWQAPPSGGGWQAPPSSAGWQAPPSGGGWQAPSSGGGWQAPPSGGGGQPHQAPHEPEKPAEKPPE